MGQGGKTPIGFYFERRLRPRAENGSTKGPVNRAISPNAVCNGLQQQD
jgi:hypothetical protein